MKKEEKHKQYPYNPEPVSTDSIQKEFFTAEEAALFLEPRIRSMFK